MNALDPVSDAAAYQAFLLAALGDDDPAVAQATTVAAIRTLIDDAGTDLRVRPEPGEWSVMECLGHMLDGELVSSARYRWILCEDQPELVGYDQDAWVAGLDHGAGDPEALLAFFGAMRRANLDLWARTGPEGRERVGMHRERGPESYSLQFHLIGGHDRIHLAQARRALEAVRALG